VVHNYVHQPRARDAGLSPRERRRLDELRGKRPLTEEEGEELADLEFLAAGSRDAWTREALEKKDLPTLRNVAKYAGARGWLTAPREELLKTILKLQEGYHYAGDASLHVDVTYTKGPFGSVERTTRHYVVERPIGPGGHVSTANFGPDAVRVELRKIDGHREMLRQGWTAERVEGYNRDAERPEVEYLTTYFYDDGTGETVKIRLPEDLDTGQVLRLSSNKRRYFTKEVKRRDGPHEQLRML
jgi:hypothetical protein